MLNSLKNKFYTGLMSLVIGILPVACSDYRVIDPKIEKIKSIQGFYHDEQGKVQQNPHDIDSILSREEFMLGLRIGYLNESSGRFIGVNYNNPKELRDAYKRDIPDIDFQVDVPLLTPIESWFYNAISELFDKDKNGILDFEEHNAIKEAGYGDYILPEFNVPGITYFQTPTILSMEDSSIYRELIDLNGDGKISREELDDAGLIERLREVNRFRNEILIGPYITDPTIIDSKTYLTDK
jgi:hypothetical protein